MGECVYPICVCKNVHIACEENGDDVTGDRIELYRRSCEHKGFVGTQEGEVPSFLLP